jgi:hypothetical protein
MIGFQAMTVRRALAAAVLASVASASLITLLGACTSGTTPNCADAADMCDPYEAGGDSGPGDGSAESSLHGG